MKYFLAAVVSVVFWCVFVTLTLLRKNIPWVQALCVLIFTISLFSFELTSGSMVAPIIFLYTAGSVSMYYYFLSNKEKITLLTLCLMVYSALLAALFHSGARFLNGGGF